MKYLLHEKYGKIGYIRDDKVIITASVDTLHVLANEGVHIQLTIIEEESKVPKPPRCFKCGELAIFQYKEKWFCSNKCLMLFLIDEIQRFMGSWDFADIESADKSLKELRKKIEDGE